MPPHTTTAKITTKLQNNYHPESSENPVVWKSDNQGIKEAIFAQKDRRGGDAETHRRGVPQPHVVDKNQEGYLDTRDPSSTPDHPAQGSSARKISLHNFWL